MSRRPRAVEVGALRVRHRQGRRLLDLAPLVDVSLILVVFLLLNGSRQDLRQVPVALPQAASGQALAQIPTLRITVASSGELARDGQACSLEDLAQTPASAQVLIVADDAARHGRVVAVLDVLRRAGVASIGYLVLEPEDGDDW